MNMFENKHVAMVKKQNSYCSFAGLLPRQLVYITFKSEGDLYGYRGLTYGASDFIINFMENSLDKVYMVHTVTENRLALTTELLYKEHKRFYYFGQHDIVSILPIEAGAEDLVSEENGILTIGGIVLSDEETLGVFKSIGSHIIRRRDNGAIQSKHKERSSP